MQIFRYIVAQRLEAVINYSINGSSIIIDSEFHKNTSRRL